MKAKIIIFILFTLVVFSLYSQQEVTTPDEIEFDESSIMLNETGNEANEVVSNGNEAKLLTAWDFIKVILLLIAVILIVYGIFYFLRKAGGSKYQSNNLIKLLGTQSLTQNCSVHVIEAGAKYYLIGCSDNSVTHIADIEDKESIDTIIVNTPVDASGKNSFSELIGAKFGRNVRDRQNIDKKVKKNKEFVKDQAERLKNM